MSASQPRSGYVAQVIRAAVDVLPIALGLLMASAPLVMVSMALVIRRSVGAGWSFVLGWILGLVIVCAVVVAVADLVSIAGETGTVGGVVGVVVGVILVGLGVWKWYGAWRNPNKGEVPSWYESIERMRGSTVFAFGIGMAALNPKNLFLAVAAGVAVAEATDNIGAQVVGIVVFVVVGSIGVAAPTVATQLAGDRAGATLARVDEVITRYNSVIVGAVLIILGAVVTTNGIDALLAS